MFFLSPFIMIISAKRQPLLVIAFPKVCPQQSVLCCLHSTVSCDLHQDVGPPCKGSTNTASFFIIVNNSLLYAFKVNQYIYQSILIYQHLSTYMQIINLLVQYLLFQMRSYTMLQFNINFCRIKFIDLLVKAILKVIQYCYVLRLEK